MSVSHLIAVSVVLLVYSQLPGRALGCGLEVNELTLSVTETAAQDQLLGSVRKSNDTLQCDRPSCGFDIQQYIQTDNLSDSVEFVMKKPFGDSFDKGEIPPFVFFICVLQCGSYPLLVVNVNISDDNNRAPVFSTSGEQSITLSQSMPTGIDFGSLISGGQLSVSDGDFDTNANGAIELSVDNPIFDILPPAVATISNIEYKLNSKIYFPRIALAQPLTENTTFQLIAKDKGTPQKTSSISISVIMEPFEDLEFQEDFYTATVSNPLFTGILPIDQGQIRVKNSGAVQYSIANETNGAKLELIAYDNGVDVKLVEPVDSTTLNKNTLIVVIQADLEGRTRRVVLVIEVPPAATTTETSTSRSTQTTQELTCPTVTYPVVTCETCPPCKTTVEMTCPTAEMTTPCDCSNTCPTTPVTETTPCPLTCPTAPTTCDCSTVTPTASTALPNSSTDHPLTTDNPLSCPPITQCPTVTPPECPTTCPPPTECPTTCPPPTECPTTCPPPTECPTTCLPPTECLTTCPTSAPPTECPATCPPQTVCPTVTPPGAPEVTFERQVYKAQAVASETGDVLQVKAVVNSQSAITYSLISDGNSPFSINATSGMIRSTLPLQQSVIYQMQAEARVDSGQQDTAQVTVEAVPKVVSCDAEFVDGLYQFAVEERKTGSLGSVSFTDDSYALSIGWTLPDGFQDSFSVSSTGALSVTKAIEYQTVSRIWLGVEAKANAALRHSPFSTIVDVTIKDVNDPPQFKYPQQLVIGYPQRTLIDPSVPMPLFTFQAVDSDAGDNAVLTYSLTLSPSAFSIDPQTGALHLTGSVGDSCSSKCNITVSATDKAGLSATQKATISPLVAEEIHVLSCDGSDTLKNEEIAADLSRVLDYQVSILLRRKTPTASRANISFDVTLYAVSNGQFVSRNAFQAKIIEKKAELSKLPWKLTTETVADIPPYEADDLVHKVDDLAQSKSDLTVATAVLGSLIGVAILAAVALLVFKQVKEGRIPSPKVWNSGKEAKSDRRDSLTRTREFLAKKSTSKADDSSSGTLSSLYENGLPRTRIQISDQRVFIDEELEKRSPPAAAKRNGVDDTPYNPESPKPKKSIMKEPKNWDSDDMDKRKSGVKFHPTPEVIQVAPTTPVVTEDDSDQSASDPETEVEVL